MENAPRSRCARFRSDPWGWTARDRRIALRQPRQGTRLRAPGGGLAAIHPIKTWNHAGPSPAEVDGLLLQAVKDRRVASIPEVIAVMDRIDRCLPDGDGLKWFNLLYKTVTQRVADDFEADVWHAPRWLARLIVVFADLYFDAIERYLVDAETTPRVWRVLFDRRRRPGIAPVQHCMAGINAHINRDLPVAIVRAWEAEGTTTHSLHSPEYHDYRRVSDLLDEVEVAMLKQLATGIFKTIGEIFGGAEGWAAMRVVRQARLLAWVNAILLARVGLTSDEGRRRIQALDAAAARYGQAMLRPTE